MHTSRSPRILTVLVMIFIIIVLAAIVFRPRPAVPKPSPVVAPKAHAIAFNHLVKISVPEHLIYRYSVIDGGVRTLEEFKMKVKQDPVLAGLTCEEAKLIVIEKDAVVFTKFRRGDTIKWNRRPILIKAGERAITGCGRTVLMRCGNEISLVPQEPSENLPPGTLEIPTNAPAEAPPIVVTPEAPPIAVPNSPITTTEKSFSPPIFTGGGGFTGHGTGGGTIIPPSAPIPVPEPSVFQLLVEGALGLAIFMFIISFRKRV